jgi:hypothetical protein
VFLVSLALFRVAMSGSIVPAFREVAVDGAQHWWERLMTVVAVHCNVARATH